MTSWGDDSRTWNEAVAEKMYLDRLAAMTSYAAETNARAIREAEARELRLREVLASDENVGLSEEGKWPWLF